MRSFSWKVHVGSSGLMSARIAGSPHVSRRAGWWGCSVFVKGRKMIIVECSRRTRWLTGAARRVARGAAGDYFRQCGMGC